MIDPPLTYAGSDHGRVSAAYSQFARGVVRILDTLSAPRPLPLLLAGVLLTAIAYCFLLFSFSFLAGTSPVWSNARGVVTNSWADMPTALSGYFYFIRDGWRLPLFHVAGLGGADGTNIIFTDSIPLLALLGRALYRVAGLTVNPYGAWTAFCFVASALSMTWLVALLGQRSIASAVIATVFGLCMPALLFRWGHLALMAQFEIVLALGFAVASKRHCRPLPHLIASALLCLLALWTNAYLFVMVSGIVGAAIGQALLDRSLCPRIGLGLITTLAAVILGAMLLSGYFSGKHSLSDMGFGLFSMNLLSPLAVQASGIFTWRNGILDATGGQYEGFAYLGLGILLLLFTAIPEISAHAVSAWKRYPILVTVLAAFTAFALSNQIYVGAWPMPIIPLPEEVLKLAGVFRSSGRFIWPVLYGISAMTIVATARRSGRGTVLLLLAASVLQWFDTAPLRAAIAASAAAPASLPLNADSWSPAIARHNFVRVLPSFGCLAIRATWDREVAMEVQFLSAVAGVPTNTVYTGRHQGDCVTEQDVEPRIDAREMRIYLHGSEGFRQVRDKAGEAHCSITPDMALCSELLDGASRSVLLDARRAREEGEQLRPE
jgi:Family of unknown function (DUF6311)